MYQDVLPEKRVQKCVPRDTCNFRRLASGKLQSQCVNTREHPGVDCDLQKPKRADAKPETVTVYGFRKLTYVFACRLKCGPSGRLFCPVTANAFVLNIADYWSYSSYLACGNLMYEPSFQNEYVRAYQICDCVWAKAYEVMRVHYKSWLQDTLRGFVNFDTEDDSEQEQYVSFLMPTENTLKKVACFWFWKHYHA